MIGLSWLYRVRFWSYLLYAVALGETSEAFAICFDANSSKFGLAVTR